MYKRSPFAGKIAVLPTPFETDGAVDWFALDRLLNRAIELGYSSVALCTAFGEGSSISSEEKIKIFEEAALVAECRAQLIITVERPAEAEIICSCAADISAAGIFLECPLVGRGVYTFLEKCARFGLPLAVTRASGVGNLKAFPEFLAIDAVNAIGESGRCFLETAELCASVGKRAKGEVFCLDERLFPAMEALGAVGTLSRSALFVPENKRPSFELAARLAASDGIAYAKELLRESGICGETVRLPQ